MAKPSGTALRRRQPNEITTWRELQAELQQHLHLLIKVHKRNGPEFSIGARPVDPAIVEKAIAEGLVEHVGCDLFGIPTMSSNSS